MSTSTCWYTKNDFLGKWDCACEERRERARQILKTCVGIVILNARFFFNFTFFFLTPAKGKQNTLLHDDAWQNISRRTHPEREPGLRVCAPSLSYFFWSIFEHKHLVCAAKTNPNKIIMPANIIRARS